MNERTKKDILYKGIIAGYCDNIRCSCNLIFQQDDPVGLYSHNNHKYFNIITHEEAIWTSESARLLDYLVDIKIISHWENNGYRKVAIYI